LLNLQEEFLKIEDSFSRISNIIYQTPVLLSEKINKALNAEITFKAECLQETGSFKLRGASSAISILSDEEKSRGVVAFSSGNHAQGIAYAAKQLGTSAKIIMPSDAPRIKIDKTQEYGAEVIFYDRDNDDRENIGSEIALNEKRKLVKPFDDLNVIYGQGTAALEVVNEVDTKFDLSVVCCSGGGLAAGTGIVLKNKIKDCQLYTAEPKGWNDHEKSFLQKNIISIKDGSHGICDALENPQPGKITFNINSALNTQGLSADDKYIIEAMKILYDEFDLIVEPSGAIGLACILQNKEICQNKKVFIILSGGNIDANRYNELLGIKDG
tara:strand:- start:249 stop:1229 length:981 start_codon:yes stop_codon:yes gene_type:complete